MIRAGSESIKDPFRLSVICDAKLRTRVSKIDADNCLFRRGKAKLGQLTRAMRTAAAGACDQVRLDRFWRAALQKLPADPPAATDQLLDCALLRNSTFSNSRVHRRTQYSNKPRPCS
jgi:hypothetical protein